VGFFQHYKNWAGPTNPWSAWFAAQRDLEEEIEHDADSDVSGFSRNTAEIKDRDGLLFAKPLLHNLNERILSLRIANWFLEETQLWVEKAQTEKVRGCSMDIVHGAFVR
jgi:hypothetical protein